jgi:ssDNA-binding Zn-finger/Zn-ribbon topoisomerase 1
MTEFCFIEEFSCVLYEECPSEHGKKCNGFIVAKMGAYGPLSGCSNFPACRYIENITVLNQDLKTQKNFRIPSSD